MTLAGFRPNDRRARVATFGLVLAPASHLLFYLWPYFVRHEGYGRATEADFDRMLTVSMVLFAAMAAAYVFCALAFLTWFGRAYGNARRLGLRTIETPTWAVLGWFLPVWNLFRPAELTAAMWREAHGEGASIGPVAGWWACLILSPTLRAAGIFLLRDGRILLPWYLGDLATLLAAMLAIRVVRRLTAAQADLARRVDTTVFD
jgi:hypothetical protein